MDTLHEKCFDHDVHVGLSQLWFLSLYIFITVAITILFLCFLVSLVVSFTFSALQKQAHVRQKRNKVNIFSR